MLFLLATPEYTNTQSNTVKVRVHLRNGVAEIFDKHQDLMGKVENNLLEIETAFENRFEKALFLLQDAVFIVSNKGLDTNVENPGTGIYVYAKKVREINQNFSIDELSKEYDQKKATLDLELAKLSTKENESLQKSVGSKLLLLQEDVEFLKRSIVIIKELKS